MNAAVEVVLGLIGLATAVMAFLSQKASGKAAAAAATAAAATERNHAALQQIQVTVDGNLAAVRKDLADATQAMLVLCGEASEAIGVKLEKERQADEPGN